MPFEFWVSFRSLWNGAGGGTKGHKGRWLGPKANVRNQIIDGRQHKEAVEPSQKPQPQGGITNQRGNASNDEQRDWENQEGASRGSQSLREKIVGKQCLIEWNGHINRKLQNWPWEDRLRKSFSRKGEFFVRKGNIGLPITNWRGAKHCLKNKRKIAYRNRGEKGEEWGS